MTKEILHETDVVFDVPLGYQDNARLDAYLTSCIQNATRNRVARGIDEGRVSVNGRVATKPSLRVQAGDHIVCTVTKPVPIKIEPEEIPLDIRFEDDDVIVLIKPAGMVVHPAYGHRSGTLVNALLFHMGRGTIEMAVDDAEPNFQPIEDKNVNSQQLRPGIVHRLDKDTSGLMVAAKNADALSNLGKQFHAHSIERKYLAILWGAPTKPTGRITTHLGRNPRDRKKVAVVPEDAGKLAATNYEVVEEHIYTSLVRFRLETGRTHQIRVHAADMGNPVFGDTTYGGDRIRFGPVTKNRTSFHRNLFAKLPSQALHAEHLSFVHPTSGKTLSFDAPLSDAMQYILDRLRTHSG